MRKLKLLVLLIVIGVFSACSEEPGDTPGKTPESGVLIDVVVSGDINTPSTRVTYNPNEDNSVYVPS